MLLHPKMWNFEFLEARIDQNCIDARQSDLYLTIMYCSPNPTYEATAQ